jgi:hypothetical protein
MMVAFSQHGGPVSRQLASLFAALVVSGAVPAFAQDTRGAGKVELTLFPGWLSLTEPDVQPEPAFSQFLFGGGVNVNLGPVGIEGELVMAVGRSQDLEFGSRSTLNARTPHVITEFANLIVPVMGNRRAVVPYVTAGIGEFTFMRTRPVGHPDTETLFSGNFGGGVKWYSMGRWGIRGDYRYSLVRSKFDAPGSFVGRELRKAHRFYGGLIVNLIPAS